MNKTELVAAMAEQTNLSKKDAEAALKAFIDVVSEELKKGRVLVNDRPAKASAQVKAGDVLEIQFGSKSVRVEVLNVQETVKKEEAQELYRYL